MKISLMVLSAGKAAGTLLPINAAQFIIGRDPECNLRPGSAMISKRHCAVIVKNEQVFVRDFDSTNGTFVNEKQLKGEVQLQDGDVLKVGPLSFKVMIESQPAPVVAAPKPAPKATPKPVLAKLSDEDAAAAMLSFDDDEESGPARIGAFDTSEDKVPDGSTEMELPAFISADDTLKEPAPDAKPEVKKPEPKKHAAGAAQDAAKAILDKIRTGKRK